MFPTSKWIASSVLTVGTRERGWAGGGEQLSAIKGAAHPDLLA